jgi:thymidylate synthase
VYGAVHPRQAIPQGPASQHSEVAMTGIPILSARGTGIAQAWENALVELHRGGCRMQTQYDKPGDPPSIDATMLVTIEDPLAEPMIHKDFPGGLEDLQEYVMEVLDGIKNHLVRDRDDPTDTRWEYTYNERLFAFRVPGIAAPFDQIETMARKLAEAPHTRRAQAVTWKVWEDNDCYDPACLQSIWCRLSEDAGSLVLNTNVRFRSNDAYKAAFMNMFALVQLQQRLAERITALAGRSVRVGRYLHLADSFHLYGAYFREFSERFLPNLERRSFAERVFRYADVKDLMEEARPRILAKVAGMGRK